MQRNENDKLKILYNSRNIGLTVVFFIIDLFYLSGELKADNSVEENIAALYRRVNLAESDTAKISTMIDISQYYRYKNLDSAFVYAKRAYKLSKAIHFKQMETAYTLGVAYDMFNDLLNAKEYYIEAYNLSEKAGNTKVLCATFNAIGTNFALLDEFDIALEYFNMSLNCCTNNDERYHTLFNIGQTQIYLKKYDEAYNFLQQALNLAEKANNKDNIVRVYICLGDLFFEQGDYQKSLDHYKKALDLKIPAYDLLAVSSMGGIARNYLYIGKINEAIKINLMIDSISGKAQYVQQQHNACFDLSVLYDSVGEPEIALKYYTKYSILKDSIYRVGKTRQINFLNLEFETARKELQIADLEKEAKFRRILILILIILGVLFVFILFYILRNTRQRNKILVLEKEMLEQQKANEILEKQKLKLEVYTKDRELLTRILQINQQKEALTQVSTKVNNIINCENLEQVYGSVKILNSNILTKIKLCDDWDQIKLHFEKVHPDFFSNLKKDYSDLTLNELKLCAYTKLGFSIKEISRLLSINPGSVRIARYRLKKKLKMSEEDNFCDFIITR